MVKLVTVWYTELLLLALVTVWAAGIPVGERVLDEAVVMISFLVLIYLMVIGAVR